MSIKRDKLAAQLRAAKTAIEALQAEIEAEPASFLGVNENVTNEFAETISIQSASIAGLLLDGMAEVLTDDQFQGVDDELSVMMKAQIEDFNEANTLFHVERPMGATYRAKELGVGEYA